MTIIVHSDVHRCEQVYSYIGLGFFCAFILVLHFVFSVLAYITFVFVLVSSVQSQVIGWEECL